MPFWQNFRQGRDGLLVRPSRIPHRISKILFALGANEFLENYFDLYQNASTSRFLEPSLQGLISKKGLEQIKNLNLEHSLL